MASRPKGYGMTAELDQKKAAKYDVNMEKQARDWMEAMIREPLSDQGVGAESFHAALKDGIYLCKLANGIQPGAISKIETSKMAFKQMENIGKFLSFCENYGVNRTDLFQTVDLFEQQNMWQVVLAIHALGRKAQSKGLRGIGPKESQQNIREFSEEQLRAGEGVIGLQMGSNKGASQAGQNFGKTRAIID